MCRQGDKEEGYVKNICMHFVDVYVYVGIVCVGRDKQGREDREKEGGLKKVYVHSFLAVCL